MARNVSLAGSTQRPPWPWLRSRTQAKSPPPGVETGVVEEKEAGGDFGDTARGGELEGGGDWSPSPGGDRSGVGPHRTFQLIPSPVPPPRQAAAPPPFLPAGPQLPATSGAVSTKESAPGANSSCLEVAAQIALPLPPSRNAVFLGGRAFGKRGRLNVSNCVSKITV